MAGVRFQAFFITSPAYLRPKTYKNNTYNIDDETLEKWSILKTVLMNRDIPRFYQFMQVKRFLFGRRYGERSDNLLFEINLAGHIKGVCAQLEAEFKSLSKNKTEKQFIELLNENPKRNHYARIIGLILRYVYHVQGERGVFDKLSLPDVYRDSKFNSHLTRTLFPVLIRQQQDLDNQVRPGAVILSK